MPDDLYIVAIAALLPVTAALVVTQTNPYQALVMRGILGAVAALVYALFGAADVALTEALVGTMLSITLYAIAVRSSMSLRLGVLDANMTAVADNPELNTCYQQICSDLRQALKSSYLRLECVPYATSAELHTALQAKDVHAVCTLAESSSPSPYRIQVRAKSLYTLMQNALSPTMTDLKYIPPVRPAAPAIAATGNIHSSTEEVRS